VIPLTEASASVHSSGKSGSTAPYLQQGGKEGGRESEKAGWRGGKRTGWILEEAVREVGGRDVPVGVDRFVEVPVVNILAGGEQAFRTQPRLIDLAHGVIALHTRPAWRKRGRKGRREGEKG